MSGGGLMIRNLVCGSIDHDSMSISLNHFDPRDGDPFLVVSTFTLFVPFDPKSIIGALQRWCHFWELRRYSETQTVLWNSHGGLKKKLQNHHNKENWHEIIYRYIYICNIMIYVAVFDVSYDNISYHVIYRYYVYFNNT